MQENLEFEVSQFYTVGVCLTEMELGVPTHTYDSMGEAESGESGAQGYLWLSSEYEASLGKWTAPLQAKTKTK